MSNTAKHQPFYRQASGTSTDAPLESGREASRMGAMADPHAAGHAPPVAPHQAPCQAKVDDEIHAIPQRWRATGASRLEPVRGLDDAAIGWRGASETADAYRLLLGCPAASGAHSSLEPAGFSSSARRDAMNVAADHGRRARRTSLCVAVEIVRTPQHAYAVLSLRERKRAGGHGGRGGTQVQAGWVVCAVSPAWTTHQIAAAFRVALDTVMGPAARWPDGVASVTRDAMPE